MSSRGKQIVAIAQEIMAKKHVPENLEANGNVVPPVENNHESLHENLPEPSSASQMV